MAWKRELFPQGEAEAGAGSASQGCKSTLEGVASLLAYPPLSRLFEPEGRALDGWCAGSKWQAGKSENLKA